MSDSQNVVSLDKRDLFDSVRSAIKDAMLDQGSRMDDIELFADATDKANECLRDLYASKGLITPSPDGGPAFPSPHFEDDNLSGMSLRDYFAAKASDADIERVLIDTADVERVSMRPGSIGLNNYIHTTTRQKARYIHADAMLAERAK